ncbi:BREX system ATP-binding domain-containing protein, partial [Pseudomonas viridiflava]|uniref:BREX system ATP-binding domain-containing protein n=1 Tax=Pseudomonas viridiflava TaxID=33069 RepID=UPI0013CE9187
PVIRLPSLTPEDFYVLLQNLRNVYASGAPEKYLLPDEALPIFIDHCGQRLGEAYFRTPRTTITAFINLLAVLEQNPGTHWRTLLDAVEIARDDGGRSDLDVEADDELTSFRL